jgi:xylulokinase
VPHDEVLGPLVPEAAAHLGVSPAAVVVTGTIDSITSAVGSGAIDDKTCSIIVGTTTVIVTHVDGKASDLDHGLISVPSPLPGRYFVMAENGVGGKALEWFLDNVYGGGSFAEVEAAAASAPVGSGGVLFFPWLAGSIAPSADGNVRGGFVNLGLDTTRAHLARAVYEGVALNAAWLFPHVVSFARAGWTSIRFGGGGAASALWAQILADALAVDVDQLAGCETTNARGAALLALVRLGHIALDDIPHLLHVRQRFTPDPDRVALYERLAAHFIDFHQRSRPFYASLNRRS